MTTDELRAKFEAWANDYALDVEPLTRASVRADCLAAYQAAYASRDAEVDALQDALFQISVRLKTERESDMDDMSWHTDMIARAQYLANQCQRIESAPVAIMDTRDALGICAPTEEDFPALYALQGKRVRLVVEDGE